MTYTFTEKLKVSFAALALTLSAPAFALSAEDRAICDTLIADLKSQSALTFVRNGDEYDADRAASHMAMKLDYAADDLPDVKSFIEEVASKSSFSGRDYEVIFPDGHRETARSYLYRRLKELYPTYTP